ncbi:MAG: hypothetical protein LBR26_15620 [Prevotella sp.]|jgi:hypothetical protein|nr:hypothetical protein [Prevotella sp.]
MFDDWKEKIKDNPEVSRHLLWEYDFDRIDWEEMKYTVVQRVIERGWMNDFYAIFRLYGGIAGVREIIKDLPEFQNPKDLSFVCNVFNLKKEDLLCYTRKRLREIHINS